MTPVMLFAAGFGTRMRALTQDRPKPLVEVAGKALIDHALDLATAAAPGRIVANLHYKAEMLEAHLRPHGVAISRETPEILDTGGGLRAALPLLGADPVFTMNTDAIWVGPNPLDLLRENWDPERMDALLMWAPVSRAVGHSGPGDFVADKSGRLSRGPGLVYGGAQILRTGGLRDIPARVFSLNLLWDRMQIERRLFATIYPGRWCDVGNPEGVALAEGLLNHV